MLTLGVPLKLLPGGPQGCEIMVVGHRKARVLNGGRVGYDCGTFVCILFVCHLHYKFVIQTSLVRYTNVFAEPT